MRAIERKRETRDEKRLQSIEDGGTGVPVMLLQQLESVSAGDIASCGQEHLCLVFLFCKRKGGEGKSELGVRRVEETTTL